MIIEKKTDVDGVFIQHFIRLQWIKQHPPSQVLDLCRSMVTSTRIFSFDLGKSSSRSLVKGLACTTFLFGDRNRMIRIFFLIAMWTHESSPPSFGRTIILDAIFVCGRDEDLDIN